MTFFSEHVANLNHTLKGIRSDIFIYFIHFNYCGLIVISNKVTFSSDLNVVENYIKNINFVDSNNVQSAWLLQSKLYLKSLDISYNIENTNMLIDSSVVESIIKSTHIFNNIRIISKPCVIKVFPKLDMSIVWIDIWNSQSSTSTKTLINWCFNIRSHIVTVCGANMNPGVPQCKNCWKWEHTILCGAVKQTSKPILYDLRW